jgi:uncharacterized protein with GYD domain
MPNYISLIRWTQKGVENVKESPARLEKEVIQCQITYL